MTTGHCGIHCRGQAVETRLEGKTHGHVVVFTVEKEADDIVAEKESVSFSQLTMVSTAGGLAASFRVGARGRGDDYRGAVRKI